MSCRRRAQRQRPRQLVDQLPLPVRPVQPDIWVSEDVATLIDEQQTRGRVCYYNVVRNQVCDEDLAPST